VLLDFRGTLVHSFDFAWYASRAIRALGRADASIEGGLDVVVGMIGQRRTGPRAAVTVPR
jgi:hypothetical protein